MKLKTLLFLVAVCLSVAASAQYNLSWGVSIGGNDSDDVRGMVKNSVNEIIIAGSYKTTSDFDPGTGVTNMTSAGDRDIFISKLDTNGVLQWAISMGGTLTDEAIGVDVDANDNIYITGYFMGTSDFDPTNGVTSLVAAGERDVFIAKYSTAGALIWAKQLSGTDSETGEAIVVTTSGVYTTGRAKGTVDFDPGTSVNNVTSAGGNDIFISKLDLSGNFVWINSYGSNNGDYAHAITSDVAGNIYTTGNFQNTIDFDLGVGVVNLTSAGDDDVFVLKLDAAGALVWAKAMGGNGQDIGVGIVVDASSNVYLTGFFESTGDFDPGTSVNNLTSAGGKDAFVQKLDAFGNYVWAYGFGDATEDDKGKSITIDGNGDIIFTGFFFGTVDFDPSASTTNLTSNGSSDMYLQKLDSSGGFLYANQIGSTLQDGTNEILYYNNSLYFCGKFSGTADADPNTGVTNIVSAGFFDGYIVKWTETSTTGINENISNPEFTIFPNPVIDILNLAGDNIENVKVYNVVGQDLTSTVIINSKQPNKLSINVSELSSGIYLLNVNEKTVKFYKR